MRKWTCSSSAPGRAGCQVGAGLMFGYVAARHAAEIDVSGDSAPRNPAHVDLDAPEVAR
jgi:hypothetical protein